MIDPNEIGGWIDACPNPALLITLKHHIENRLRQIQDGEAAKNLHPQLKRHMPPPIERPIETMPASSKSVIVRDAAPAQESSPVDNPYEAFQNDSSVHVPAPELDSQ